MCQLRLLTSRSYTKWKYTLLSVLLLFWIVFNSNGSWPINTRDYYYLFLIVKNKRRPSKVCRSLERYALCCAVLHIPLVQWTFNCVYLSAFDLSWFDFMSEVCVSGFDFNHSSYDVMCCDVMWYVFELECLSKTLIFFSYLLLYISSVYTQKAKMQKNTNKNEALPMAMNLIFVYVESNEQSQWRQRQYYSPPECSRQ